MALWNELTVRGIYYFELSLPKYKKILKYYLQFHDLILGYASLKCILFVTYNVTIIIIHLICFYEYIHLYTVFSICIECIECIMLLYKMYRGRDGNRWRLYMNVML